MTDDEVAEFEQAERHALTMPIDLNEVDAAVIQHRLQQILALIEERRRLQHDL